MHKKGAFTVEYIFKFAIGIAMLLVLLFFIREFFFSDDLTQDQICELSVIQRATLPTTVQGVAPLKCTPKKFCLSLTRDGRCAPQFGNDLQVENINLPNNPQQAAREIEKMTAQALLQCWRIMGEGKLDLFSESDETLRPADIIVDVLSSDKISPTCVICEQIALADDLTNTEEGKEILSQVNVNRYMESTFVPGTQITYLGAITDKQIRAYPAEARQTVQSLDNLQKTNHMAFIFMQILIEEEPLEAAKSKGITSGAVIAGGIFMTPFGKVVGVIPGALASFLGAGISAGLAYDQATQNQGIAASYCGEFVSTHESRHGCSVVTPIDYSDFSTINDLCERIEST